MSDTLEELKVKNKAEEAAAKAATEEPAAPEVDEDVEVIDEPDVDPEVDEEGNPVEKKEVEPWMQTDDGEEGDGEDYSVPAKTHVQMKLKYKGQASDLKDEVATLKAENEALKEGNRSQPGIESLKRPVKEDFDTDELYDKALDEYDDERATVRETHRQSEASNIEAQRIAKENVDKAVGAHYERADVLIKDSGISPEVYQKSDQTVREALESARPKFGDAIMDSMIMIAGEGSEKVFHYLGINQPALNKVKVLLSEDKSGYKLAAYIGELKGRLTNPKKKTSQAHKPVTKIKGDAPKANGALQKKYNKAHKENRGQDALMIKKQAKAAGTDVSTW